MTTSTLAIYEAKLTTAQLAPIASTTFNLASALLQVDLQSNSSSSSSSCTDSACGAQGFDCCISGQCVKDGTEKANASLDSQYSQAHSDYATNPLSFINYPNIYYICSNIAHTPPVASTGPTTTPISAAQARVALYLTDYICITSPLNSSGTSTCSTYSTTKARLAVACGCTAAPADMAVKCPDWGVLPVYPAGAAQINANISDFTCYTPAPINQIGPITNLNVNVPNRSAPHRFFQASTTDHTVYDSIAGLSATSPSTVQEGVAFSYQDEVNKVSPINGSYNVNSILGSMTIDLNHTLPAKQVTVELGKTYIFSATSGFFTPCTQCVKDSWFQTFSSAPNTQHGNGLQASGYTTSRDTYSGNTTFGNYEDTQFGRACYVPVTMLAHAHQKNTDVKTQRMNRLATQSALYINGYQRDWYGFNRGALIGSFDGATWFAIGSGRRATATSTKLFLAINAPFLDLADKTDTIVNIIPDFSTNVAADYDFDPTLPLTDPHQNTAGTCQNYHQCNTDADCVTQLGWEYMCADVSQSKTKWPLFDSDGNEIVNQEKTGSLFEILQGTISSATTKRCVFRGAGSPCKRDYTNLSDYDKKMLTCAPNFFCADITSNRFNDQLVRSPNELDNIFFGMDTNILGRPLNYVTATKSLTAEIISNINYNSQLFTTTTGATIPSGDIGICRPGKALTGSALTNHYTPDNLKRTDYISQIANCDSASVVTTMAAGQAKFLNCPAFDTDLNLIDKAATGVTSAVLLAQTNQNSCGGEARDTNGLSAFRSIEGLSLLNSQTITQATLAGDACLRRAGSVCHTDLDCGPNKMHESIAGSMGLSFFGGTDAEQSYWKESLVCGQGKAIPVLGDPEYFNYKLSDNRCCREVGKDFTMFTQGSTTLVPENIGTNASLITSKLSYSNPKAPWRYSRYSISATANAALATEIPKVIAGTEPEKNQWKVINETGSLTCCGGGWIRKFADGTHDWKIKNRLTLDPSKFNCLNFRSPLADSAYSNFTSDHVNQSSYQREFEDFCKSPARVGNVSGCLQVPFQDNNNFTILTPYLYSPELDYSLPVDSSLDVIPAVGSSRSDTSPSNSGGGMIQNNYNVDAPYMPNPFIYSPTRYTEYTDPTSGQKYTPTFFASKTFNYGITNFLPAYIPWDGSTADAPYITRVAIKYFYDPPLVPVVQIINGNIATGAACSAALNYAGAALPVDAMPASPTDSSWCITSGPVTQNRPVIIAKADTSATYGDWKYAGLMIDFKPVEKANGTKVAVPGNPLYYLSKLARLELLGIPQISYEPIYCNNNQDKLVPGIFKSTLNTRTDFLNPVLNPNAYTSSATAGHSSIDEYNADASASTTERQYGGTDNFGNYENKFTFQDKVDHSAIFSSKDFTCCTPLGKDTSNPTQCCSGFGKANQAGTKFTCKLPKGADINVYFNIFVSNEGVGDTRPGGGLIADSTTSDDIDFNPTTGEPKYRDSTYNKLAALGGAYCDGTVQTGGAFGYFPPEPFSGSYALSGNLLDSFPLSIVDSVLDFQSNDPNLGKIPFDSGYRWNHHLYCK